MNDRFKFRCFYDDDKTMYYHNYWEIPNTSKEEVAHLMQCTGLKDKNGVLIYEGDIVKAYFFNEDTDQWDYDLLKVIFDKEKVAFGFKGRSFCDFVTTDYLPEEYEVAGNLYENEELLND